MKWVGHWNASLPSSQKKIFARQIATCLFVCGRCNITNASHTTSTRISKNTTRNDVASLVSKGKRDTQKQRSSQVGGLHQLRPYTKMWGLEPELFSVLLRKHTSLQDSNIFVSHSSPNHNPTNNSPQNNHIKFCGAFWCVFWLFSQPPHPRVGAENCLKWSHFKKCEMWNVMWYFPQLFIDRVTKSYLRALTSTLFELFCEKYNWFFQLTSTFPLHIS